jgi:hypothetical protein
MRQLCLLLLCLSLTLTSFAGGKGPVFDVVYDLDWTLFYPVDSVVDSETISLPEGNFRLADGSAEALLRQHRAGHRISIDSGGLKSRNEALAAFAVEKVRAQGGSDFSFYKILNFEDLTPREGAPANAKFADRWIKDLRKVNPDLRRVIHVDDTPKFTHPGQEVNFYWLEKTYNFFPQFPSAHGADEFDPPSEMEWRQERQKIQTFLKHFEMMTAQKSATEPLLILQGLRLGKSLCQRVLISGTNF